MCTIRDLATNLKENKVEFKKSYLPILGIAAFVTDDYNKLSKNILDVSETLKENEGFRSVTVDEKARNIMALISYLPNYWYPYQQLKNFTYLYRRNKLLKNSHKLLFL